MVYLKLHTYCFNLIIYSSYILYIESAYHDWFQKIPVDEWANNIGSDIWDTGKKITKKYELEQAYRNEEIEMINGTETINDMSKLLSKLLELKISALTKIVEKAENETLKSFDILDKDSFSFKNAKNLEEPYDHLLKENPRFFNTPVNTEFSTVHVPTYVYERANDSMRDILWSKSLDQVFIHNYNADPTLSWQYFSAVSGVMRLYPGTKWVIGDGRVDLYDSRMRPWYVGAASSPKDVIILVDNSGSMTGQKRKIARNAINTLLETLIPDDFVNVISFGSVVKEVVSCFNRKLVQANLENIQELKLGVKDMESASGIADFGSALIMAFEILDQHHKDKTAAMCNQAIMLITDGAYENYKSIFEKYNWKNSTHKPFPIRVFTFGIGRDGADNREIKWMACANQGYYVQINTITEVREQVLKYINVMARPLVLENVHITSWTPLYAHITEPTLTSWLWKQKQNEMQLQYSLAYMNYLNSSKKDPLKLPNTRIDRTQDYDQNINSDNLPYNLITSVSLPAYDHRNLSGSTANLLGVAATDVPVTVFNDVLDPYKLGVNNYGFIVNNNGYVIIHPDLRPVFQDILKPRYNSIDILDIELLDDDSNIRNFSSQIIDFRDLIINQTSTSVRLRVKYHYDNMRRVSTCSRTYYMSKIDESPFTAVIGISDNSKYRIKQPDNIRLSENVSSYFGNKNWTVHPNWFYCKNDFIHRSPEEQIENVFTLLREAHWKWQGTSYQKYAFVDNATRCNKELVEALLYDANITRNLFNDIRSIWNMIERYKVINIFVSTRSGLTRWYTTTNQQFYPSFESTNKKSVDEVWYKRAVEQYAFMPESFVFWFPPSKTEDKSVDEETLITASYAIMVKKGEKKAPAAVVGFRFKQSALQELFLNNSGCHYQPGCKDTIQNPPSSYYILDHNAYILASLDKTHIGKFFGHVHGHIMKSLVKQTMYRQIAIYDYQAVCFHYMDSDDSGGASTLLTLPIKHAINLVNWMISSLVWWFAHINFQWMMTETSTPPITIITDDILEEEDVKERDHKIRKKIVINRTRMVPCDQTVNLYELTNLNRTVEMQAFYKATRIQHTNLVLIIVKEMEISNDNFDTIPKEKDYGELPSPACYKVKHNWFSRRRVKYCKKEHDQEKLIEHCGNGVMNTSSSKIMALLIAAIVVSYRSAINF